SACAGSAHPGADWNPLWPWESVSAVVRTVKVDSNRGWRGPASPAISGRETPWLVSGQAVPSRKTIQSGRESWLVDAAATPQRKPPAGKGATARFDGVDCDAGIFLFARPPMSTAPLYHQPGHGPRISFELYPPRTPRGGETLRRTVAELAALEPDFFSVTYGASGKTRETSREVIDLILAETDTTPLAHLTCVGASAEDLGEYVGSLLDRGVRDFLALRGDPPD